MHSYIRRFDSKEDKQEPSQKSVCRCDSKIQRPSLAKFRYYQLINISSPGQDRDIRTLISVKCTQVHRFVRNNGAADTPSRSPRYFVFRAPVGGYRKRCPPAIQLAILHITARALTSLRRLTGCKCGAEARPHAGPAGQ